MAHPRLTAREEYALYRKRVAELAARGSRPSDGFRADDLAEAFLHHEDELAELEQLAERVRIEKRDRQQAVQTKQLLSRETKRVMDEWYREEQAKLRAKAEKVARERLGLEAKP
jgi:hypothetical protein